LNLRVRAASAARGGLAWLLLSICAGGAAEAHDFAFTDALLVLKTDRTYQIDLRVDVDALALGVSPRADAEEVVAKLSSLSAAEFEAAVEQARDTLLRRVRLRVDGEKLWPTITFPQLENPVDEPAVPTVLGTVARLDGPLPEGARELTFGASRAFSAVHLTILDQASATGVKHVLAPGAECPPYRIGEPADVAAAPARGETVARYLVLGFEHILPRGLDHILFVLGLFLLSARLAPLLWQVSAFTIAHTVTLALSMYGLVQLPSRLVETLIALSIAYVAVENLFTSELKPWRPLLVFAFGLLHGLGFAGVLRELGLPEGEYVPALIAFNVGVELGQLTVIASALLLVGRLRDRPWYRRAVVLPASLAIALVGLYWAVQRAFG
jgi:hypothetical protein